jgi:diamine N-acetyltransferase
MSKDSLIIRAATNEDVSILSDLGAETFIYAYRDTIGAEDLRVYTQATFAQDRIAHELDMGQGYYALAEVDDQPGGYGLVKVSKVPVGVALAEPIELQRLYVLPQWLGQGMGTALLRHMMTWVEEHGYRCCWLRVWIRNTRAIAFYEHWGFQAIGSEPYTVGEASEPVLIMAKTI